MAKAALGSSAAFLLAATCHVAHGESLPSIILECNGPVLPTSTGLPKGETEEPIEDDVRFRMVIHGGALTIEPIKIGRSLTIGIYKLCHSTSTSYVFSNECTADQEQYIQDWLKTTDLAPSTSPWYKKYEGSSAFHLMTITVDRMNLDASVDDTKSYQMKTEPPKPYTVSYWFNGACRQVKPKF
ncbi:hypothetical protein M3I54_39960 [Paraburkholderia sp. CNPSo 3274]|uniref:hypothetical protein n=1 Tax=Paraburkholderia sp. CNPSo 3274 TaxID=2940932 RepID=UPI0020B70103|nr:hypothetical protein [Paraburkholderia sp. CNPSo 3274]MCP3712999.1 hypothetical protein [Paraburkholderia sp. CNPSo 3274]